MSSLVSLKRGRGRRFGKIYIYKNHHPNRASQEGDQTLMLNLWMKSALQPHVGFYACVRGYECWVSICVFDTASGCCSSQKLSVRASLQFEVDQGVSRCRAVQAAAAVHRAATGGIFLLTCCLYTPLLSSVVVICVSSMYLDSLSLLSSPSLLYL